MFTRRFLLEEYMIPLVFNDHWYHRRYQMLLLAMITYKLDNLYYIYMENNQSWASLIEDLYRQGKRNKEICLELYNRGYQVDSKEEPWYKLILKKKMRKIDNYVRTVKSRKKHPKTLVKQQLKDQIKTEVKSELLSELKSDEIKAMRECFTYILKIVVELFFSKGIIGPNIDYFSSYEKRTLIRFGAIITPGQIISFLDDKYLLALQERFNPFLEPPSFPLYYRDSGGNTSVWSISMIEIFFKDIVNFVKKRENIQLQIPEKVIPQFKDEIRYCCEKLKYSLQANNSHAFNKYLKRPLERYLLFTYTSITKIERIITKNRLEPPYDEYREENSEYLPFENDEGYLSIPFTLVDKNPTENLDEIKVREGDKSFNITFSSAIIVITELFDNHLSWNSRQEEKNKFIRQKVIQIFETLEKRFTEETKSNLDLPRYEEPENNS